MKKTLLIVTTLFLALVSWSQQNGSFFSKAGMAKDLVKPQLIAAGVTVSDIDQSKLSSETFSRQSGVNNIYYQQTVNGIPVYNAILNVHITRDNKLLTYGNRFVKVDAALRSIAARPVLSPEQAVNAAMASLGIAQAGLLQKKISGTAPEYVTVFDKGKISLEDIKVQLVYQPVEEKTGKTEKGNEPVHAQVLRLAWQVEIYATDAKNWWSARMDASTGILLDKSNYVVSCDFGGANTEPFDHAVDESYQKNFVPYYSFLNFKTVNNLVGSNDYRVYAPPAESPNHVTPLPPADGRTLISDPANLTASPFGWHDINGVAGAEFTTTQGNNVHAYTDVDANNTPDPGSSPDGTASLVFDFPLDLTQAPAFYRPAAVTNLFFWNNYIHDFAYGYGFDEVSGNFQENNYGRGGTGSDYVQAEAQDGSGTNNANFATPADGLNPRMQMYIWTAPTPDKDGDIDNGIIAHEYGHGISNRLTGGPANVNCLNNVEQMGEGWSDFYAYMITMRPTDDPVAGRGIGTYALDQPTTGVGIRLYKYSTDMTINPFTYNSIKVVAIPHGVGSVWATMLWDLAWKFIGTYGYTDGFNKTMQLVMDGMKLQPCSPGFVDGRNAILAADQALYGGANQCLIWEVFARRGLGFSASQGSSNSVQDGTQAFDMPLTCLVDVTPKKLSVCKPADAVYNVANGTNISYTMTTSGEPAGTTVNFSPNPVPAGSTGTMTIGNTGAAAAGTYIITVTATNGANIVNQNITLIIQSSSPAAPVLISPADGATNQTSPLLTWAAVSNAETYEVQLATDAGFTNIVASATGLTGTTYQTNGLTNLTVHYWRVRAVNSCGNGNYSAAFSFTTANIICSLTPSTNVPVPIPDVSTITSTLTFSGAGAISDVNVRNLNVTHTWIDDLIIDLKSPAGTTVRLMNRPCGGEDNILINFDDQAATATFPCPPTNNGTYIPFAALSAFIGQNPSGTWTLTISDNAGQDIGTLNSWSLEICYAPSCNVAVQAPTVTQPDCATSTGTIVVNATGTGTLEYSIDNGASWFSSATFSGLSSGNYTIKVRSATDPTCSAVYSGNPVVINPAPLPPVPVIVPNGPLEFCSGGSVQLNAFVQNQNYLQITSPAVINMNTATAVFGPQLPGTPVSGSIVYIHDGSSSYLGCNPYPAGSLAGKVVLIDRGLCLFTIKVVNAQTAGAIGVIIVNNVAGPPITMGGADPSITIPTIMISMADGNIIKNLLLSSAVNGITMEHTYSYLWSTTETTSGITVNASGNYTVEVTDENGCKATSEPVTVTVSPIPVLRETYNGIQVTANNDGVDDAASFSVCSSTSDNVFLTEITDVLNITPAAKVKAEQQIIKTNVNINTAADGVYLLSTIGPIPLGKTATLINPTISGTVVIKRRAFFDDNLNNILDANECVGDWVVYTITVNPIPDAVAAPPAQTVCTGNAITTIVLSGSVAGTVYNWTRDNPGVTGIAAAGSGNISGTLTNATAAPVTVTFTITPTANNCPGASTTATVTVNPNQYFACPPNMTETINDVICFKAVVTPNPVFCGALTKLTWKLTGATTLSSPTTGINYLGVRNMNVGTTTVTYTATFTGGVVKTCSFTVLVIETIPPEIRCPADIHVNTDPGKCYKTGPVSLGNPVTGDNCGVLSVTNNAPAVYVKGVNFVTWTVTDKSGNTRTCVQRVTVNDVEKPVITCPANVVANTGPVCTATSVTVPPPVFSDNCGVVTLVWSMVGVTWGNSPNTGINYVPTMNYATGVSTITYIAVDEAGNQKSCTFTVTVKDVTPPTLTCPPAQTFCKVPNNTYTVPPLVQIDNCVIASTTYAITGVTSRTGTGTNASGIFNQGVSTIKWTVKDVNGNTSTCTTTITVVPTTNPICSPPPFTFTTDPVIVVNSPAEAVQKKGIVKDAPVLSLTAWPNPSENYFNLKVTSPDRETLLIRMYDMAGKLVETKKGMPGQTYLVGERVVSGMYIIEVRQGDKTVRAKLVKN